MPSILNQALVELDIIHQLHQSGLILFCGQIGVQPTPSSL